MTRPADAAGSTARGNRRVTLQFVRFLFIGALNTLFGYAVFALLIHAGLQPDPALLLTYIVGVVFNYGTTGRWVFAQGGFNAFPRFVMAYVVIYLFNAVLFHLVERLTLSPLIAQALCIPVVAVFAFALFKFRVFRSRP